MPGPDGYTLRDHYQAAAAQGSPTAKLELDGLPLPDAAAHVWQWFLELHAARGGGGFGPAPLGYGDIEAWQRLTHSIVAPNELGWLIDLDHTFLRANAEKSKGGKTR